MKLDRNYFNNLTLNYVNRDYYSADDVDNALVEIRKIALEMCAQIDSLTEIVAETRQENKDLKELLELTQNRRDETSERAVDEIKSLLAQVEQKKKEIEQLQIDKEDRLVGIIADVFERMKDEHRENVVEINAQWQNFLTKLSDDEAPQDISEKVRRIAQEMQAISDSMPDFSKKTEE